MMGKKKGSKVGCGRCSGKRLDTWASKVGNVHKLSAMSGASNYLGRLLFPKLGVRLVIVAQQQKVRRDNNLGTGSFPP